MTQVPNYLTTHRQLLSPEEELQLFTEWKANQNPKLYEKIIRCYSPIILKQAKKLAGYGVPIIDLIGEGQLGLCEAATRYEIDRDRRFATYALWWVKGLMLAYIARNYFAMNVNSNQRMKHIFFNLRRVINLYHAESVNGGDPAFYEKVAEKLSTPDNTVSPKDVQEMHTMFSRPAQSLASPINSKHDGDDSMTLEAMIPDEAPLQDEIVMTTMLEGFHRRIVYDAVRRVLTAREQKIFIAQVLSEEDDQRTLQDLADELKLSKERIRQIREGAQEKVKVAILSKFPKSQRDNFFLD